MQMERLGQAATNSLSTSLTTFSLSSATVLFILALRRVCSTNPALVVGVSLRKSRVDFLFSASWLISSTSCSSKVGKSARTVMRWLMQLRWLTKIFLSALKIRIFPTMQASISVAFPSQCFLQLDRAAMCSYRASLCTCVRWGASAERTRQALNLISGSRERRAPRSRLRAYSQLRGRPKRSLLSPGVRASSSSRRETACWDAMRKAYSTKGQSWFIVDRILQTQ